MLLKPFMLPSVLLLFLSSDLLLLFSLLLLPFSFPFPLPLPFLELFEILDVFTVLVPLELMKVSVMVRVECEEDLEDFEEDEEL